MLHLAWIIPLIPFAACAVLIFFGAALTRRLGERVGWIGVAGIAATVPFSLGCLTELILGASPVSVSVPWLSVGEHVIRTGYQVDPLSAAMLVMVSIVATCIQIYSIGYMHGDSRFARFFAYLSLFCGSMFLILLSNGFIMLYAGWELVGLCSYLLIGFWFERPAAAEAAKKAFITTRIGDVGFAIGILVLFHYVPSLMMADVFHAVQLGFIPLSVAGLAAALLFCGAIGKSAQFPLHVWLPDAMEGPTPVSALIHAATMVAAGVFMVARLFPLFYASLGASIIFGAPALTLVAIIGLITALMAAVIGTVQTDIKRVLAYSTISQLGYMMASLGLGVVGFTAGVFHLLTHAFFKALLFLGSGSVIHGCHEEQDIRQMGGLARRMPVTYLTFWAGTLALVGLPPFAGFFSKDEIMAAAWSSGLEDPAFRVFFWGLEIGAFLTAFYMGRLCFLTFSGQARSKAAEHAHESPAVMTVPLVVLAVFAVFMGWIGTPWVAGNLFHQFIHFTPPDTLLELPGHASAAHATLVEHVGAEPEGTNWFVVGISTLMALSGLFVSALIYYWKLANLESVTWPRWPSYAEFAAGVPQIVPASVTFRGYTLAIPECLRQMGWRQWAQSLYQGQVIVPDLLRRPFHPLYLLVSNKFYFDDLYAVIPVALTFALARGSRLVDIYVVDGLVNGIGWTVRWAFGGLAWLIDTFVVDGLVNAVGYGARWTGEIASRLQTGHVQEYVSGFVMFACGIAGVTFAALWVIANLDLVVGFLRGLCGG